MYRCLIALTLVMVLALQPVYAFPLMDSAAQRILTQTWDAQTLNGLANGVVAVPEAAVNDYLETVLPDYPSIRQAYLSIQPGNQITLNLDTRTNGRLLLKGKIIRFIQNSTESSISIAVTQKKLLNKPLASWFFAHMSLGILAKMFGNPLNAAKDNFSSRIDGNVITINFRPYIDRSPLRTASVYGVSPADLFSVDSVSTAEGVLELHTSYHGSALSLDTLKRMIPY